MLAKRLMNLGMGLVAFGGMLMACVALTSDTLTAHAHSPAGTVVAAVFGVAAVLNGLFAGDNLGRALLGRDEDQ